jgi:hypothetical protein
LFLDLEIPPQAWVLDPLNLKEGGKPHIHMQKDIVKDCQYS